MLAELDIDQQTFKVNIHDISLNGAMLSAKTNGISLTQKLGLLTFHLNNDSAAKILMNVVVVHQEGDDIHVQCNGIDIDSVSLLRRLIELNLADDEQLHKELSLLSRT